MVLTPEQEQFWQAYLTEHPDAGAHTRHVVAGRPGSPGIADQLIELYLSGVKTAGSGLVEDYLVPRQATLALLMVAARLMTLRSRGSVAWLLRQMM